MSQQNSTEQTNAKVPGVTTITGNLPKPWLQYWGQKLVAEEAVVTGIFTLLAQRLRKENRDSHDEVVVVLNDICETLESIDDNVGKMDEWQQDHQRLHDANG